jgi:nitrite reductase/ring-hydroxylating ferredoxin subunit
LTFTSGPDGALTFVGRVPLTSLQNGEFVRLTYEPFHVLVALVSTHPPVAVAIEDACNHAGASLSEGERLRGDCVSCPMHGYVFELRTGRLVEPRGLCSDQRTFVTRIEEGGAQGSQGSQVSVWDPGAGVTLTLPDGLGRG